jgi:hypothetical protein
MLSRPAFHAAEETQVAIPAATRLVGGEASPRQRQSTHVLLEKGTPVTDFRIDPW